MQAWVKLQKLKYSAILSNMKDYTVVIERQHFFKKKKVKYFYLTKIQYNKLKTQNTSVENTFNTIVEYKIRIKYPYPFFSELQSYVQKVREVILFMIA